LYTTTTTTHGCDITAVGEGSRLAYPIEEGLSFRVGGFVTVERRRRRRRRGMRTTSCILYV